jgi:hypothetical protein
MKHFFTFFILAVFTPAPVSLQLAAKKKSNNIDTVTKKLPNVPEKIVKTNT